MKKIFIFTACILFWACSSQNEQFDGIDDFQLSDSQDNAQLWDYPVKPGTEEWKQFQTHEEMVNACQIPEEILSSLSTEYLTDLCLRYPLLGDIFLFNFLDQGLDQLFINFNGIRELYKRENVSSCLTKRYMEKIQSFSFFDNKENIDFEIDHEVALEVGLFQISIANLDALLSRVERKNNENVENLKKILQSLVIGYEAISELAIDKKFLLQSNFFSRAHLIVKICEQCIEEIPRGKENAVFSPHGADIETAKIINELSYQLIK